MAAPAPLSPLAPRKYPTLPPVEGVRFATAAAGVRYAGRTDVMLALFDGPATVAGVFTRSKCPSAPVDWCRANLPQGQARALIVNSGNANAFTGGAGAESGRAGRAGREPQPRGRRRADFHGLDRRDRRTARRRQDRRRARSNSAPRPDPTA